MVLRFTQKKTALEAVLTGFIFHAAGKFHKVTLAQPHQKIKRGSFGRGFGKKII
jgi:hypothetical protein